MAVVQADSMEYSFPHTESCCYVLCIQGTTSLYEKYYYLYLSPKLSTLSVFMKKRSSDLETGANQPASVFYLSEPLAKFSSTGTVQTTGPVATPTKPTRLCYKTFSHS